MSERLPVVVGMTGATGAIYGVRILELLRDIGVESHLVVSRWAETTIRTETAHKPAAVRALATHVWEEEDLASPLAEGVVPTLGMIVAPCSMRTLAAIANGFADNLIQRAADSHLAAGRRLVLLARESPLSAVHLDNMLRVTRAGAVVAPPVPAFYAKLRSLDDMVDHTVGRALDQLGVPHDRIRRWGEARKPGLRTVKEG
ncbi:MAG TPA: UbiX family flavin prenyltransferase [Solirubrobacter sp.]|nr:UbiX family flavin prenyltransferase [Solirubrobacter sp.]